MDKKRHIAIFTTASLPWLTGTAVNPLFRAAYLAKDGDRKVTLVIPWLSLKHQKLVYPNNITFSSPSEQEAHVRQWLEERIPFVAHFSICFYPGKFAVDKGSILAAGDISEVIPDEEADIAILEEPEHLTWFHHGKRWKTKFRLVIGIVHTNYLEYVKREKHGRVKAFMLKYANSWVVDIYCHKIVENFHIPIYNFRAAILRDLLADQIILAMHYYIGKMVWSKGYKELLKLLRDHQKELAELEVDLYGSGEDSGQVQEAAKELELVVRVNPGRDHADPVFHDYKVFLNPSTTDVVCTTTAEALAMGKIVICANHPSNDFFKQFPNCRTYDNSNEFVTAARKALTEQPAELTDAQRHALSWEAATERFLRVAELDQASAMKLEKGTSKNFASTSFNLGKNMEDASAYLHYVVSGLEVSRRAFGAFPGSLQPDKEQRQELGLAIPAGK
ncbi:hypothetical protein GH714_019810 [Hevea brasiliensis]|uniref:Digalactosyldiacylglycerol synthase 2, chloroplastic n=1 Tax=Hevea brasiliensis TaxID=3981 RepID=A0A6A6MD48_HEVBR|nr:hypothetical protein GH714_019810 [Hevea brasiliensis]